MPSNHYRTRTTKLAVILCLIGMSAAVGATKAQTMIQHLTRPVRYQMDSAPPRITGRDALRMPAGTCIVFQIPPLVPLSGSQSLDDLKSWLPRTNETEPDTRFEIYDERKDSYWYDDMHGVDQCLPTLNCVTYALGDAAGLTIADYVATAASDATQGTNPTQVILESYFDRRDAWDSRTYAWDEFENRSDIANCDVVCFVNKQRQDYVHVMRVSVVEGQNRLVGKLGAGPVVRTTASTIAHFYRDKFDRVEVYRRKKA